MFAARFKLLSLATVCIAFLSTTPASAQEIVDSWKFFLRQPPKNWNKPQFNDEKWADGNGGFGTHGTPGARIGTRWERDDIWARKRFTLDEVPAKPALLMNHDEDAEVFINGTKVLAVKGYITEYKVFPLEGDAAKALKKGENLLAVHCHQTQGGQFIDVHVIDADNVPELPEPKRNTTPFQSELITKWGEELTPENAWTEYPRPQLQRGDWTNLNGNWDYAVTPRETLTVPTDWAGQILVPFCLESKLGGVQRLLDSTEALWYHRTFEATPAEGERTLLNFEAVDYRCEVFVNGQSVGQHQGGNTPFAFDISKAVKEGENTLVVRVEDDTEAWQLRGKQVINAHGIWYTQVSGIWQTVWLETVPASYIEDLIIDTSAADGSISIEANVDGPAKTVRVRAKDSEALLAEATGTGELKLKPANAKLWSPDSPFLYGLEVELLDDAGNTIDAVSSYAGIRTVGKTKDADGHWRFTLNGEIVFHWGPLDQGWWPDGLLTPPSDEGMLFDIEWLKASGFNMIRKHIKVEPRRYYYHCDRLGMMVWQDQVSGGKNPPWTRLQPNPTDAEWPTNEHQQFMIELERMIDELESHPSIVVWVPFNEAWGQHNTVEVGNWTSKRDPSRLVNVASGGNFWPAGDIVDQHSYPHPTFPWELGEGGRFDDFIIVMGEFGGHGYPVRDHLWDADRRNWGYGGLPETEDEYKDRYLTSLNMLNELRERGIAGGVYTQTTDVEGEINGLMTYDRKVIKIPAEKLAELHKRLFE